MSTETHSRWRISISPILWFGLFVAGLAGWLLSFSWTDAPRVWRALLIGFLYFTSLSGGLVVWLAVIRTAGGGWAREHEDTPVLGVHFLVPSMLALFLLWAASSVWAPWYGKTTPQGLWLDNTFLFGREVAALAIFWLAAVVFLKHGRGRRGRMIAAVLVIIFSCVYSLIGFDLVMALDYHWHSALFGGYYFISSLYIAMAVWGLLACCRRDSSPGFRKTIGSLLLSFSILTTYMMFCQLLPIWYENLASETRFLYDRLHFSPAREVTFILLATVYLGPLVLLLTEKARSTRWSLGGISAAILLLMWLERWWLVAPTFSHHPRLGVAEVSIGLAFAGLWGVGAAVYRRVGGSVFGGVHQ